MGVSGSSPSESAEFCAQAWLFFAKFRRDQRLFARIGKKRLGITIAQARTMQRLRIIDANSREQ
jgi:hypothetical protein